MSAPVRKWTIYVCEICGGGPPPKAGVFGPIFPECRCDEECAGLATPGHGVEVVDSQTFGPSEAHESRGVATPDGPTEGARIGGTS